MAGSFSPKPSFHLCPDFNIAPPPDGHLQLGNVLRALDLDSVLTPINIDDSIPIPESQFLPHNKPQEKSGFTRSLKELRGLKSSIWAKVFGWDNLGAYFSILRERSNEETLTVEKLLVRYFNPTPEFVKQALEVDSVAFYVRTTKFRKPIYLITGLIWTEGAKLSKTQSKKNNFKGTGTVTVPNSGTANGIGGAYEGELSISSSFDGSTPFILGIRVRKIWWDRNGTRHNENDTIGATLAGPEGNDMDVLSGLRFVDDEVDNVSEQRIVDEGHLGEVDPVTWILP
ncbi:major facilitator superfamily mfs-1 [Trichoderma arundinaceum]|uniref:Major facilitator superfamily mfs-1 n=1 Tax=Trichoderma arundinaceum TaxID=490622 RepID=A0A395NY83_TRIAR|nr:major facilitator superfamily mfs-1 [Trichoderma arundinaceum]